MTRRARGSCGFTFIEVLIALAIVGALLAIAFGGLRVALAAWNRGEDRAEAHQHVRGVALGLVRALEATYPFSGPRSDGGDAEVLFRGEEHRIEFVTEAAPSSFALPIAFAAVVMEEGDQTRPGLVVRQRALPNWSPFQDAPVVMTDPTIRSVTFAYMDEGGSWRDSWDAVSEKTLPHAVRITLGTTTSAQDQNALSITVSLRVLAP